MNRKGLLTGFERARDCREAPNSSTEGKVKDALKELVGSEPPEFTGAKEATWDLQSGVEASVTSNTRIVEAGYQANMLASEYEVTFRKYRMQTPEDESYDELVYEICIPAPGSGVVPSAWTKHRYVDPSLTFEKLVSDQVFHAETRPKPELMSLSEKYIRRIDEYDDLETSTERLCAADLEMLAKILSSAITYEGDPFEECQPIGSQQQLAEPESTTALQELFDSVADNGAVKYSLRKRIPVPLSDSGVSAYISIFIDDSEYGDLTAHARRSTQPEWMATLVITAHAVGESHKLQLIKQLNGELKCSLAMDMSPLDRINPVVNDIMSRVFDTEVPFKLPKTEHISAGIDEANQAQVDFFDRLLQELRG
jgi:hypothetical protein